MICLKVSASFKHALEMRSSLKQVLPIKGTHFLGFAHTPPGKKLDPEWVPERKVCKVERLVFLVLARHVGAYAAVSHLGVSCQGFQSELWPTALTWCYLVKQCHWDSGPSWMTWEENWMTWEESSCTEKLLHKASFCTHTQQAFAQQALHILHRETLAQRSFYTASFCALRNFYTQQAFAQRSFSHKASS